MAPWRNSWNSWKSLHQQAGRGWNWWCQQDGRGWDSWRELQQQQQPPPPPPPPPYQPLKDDDFSRSDSRTVIKRRPAWRQLKLRSRPSGLKLRSPSGRAPAWRESRKTKRAGQSEGAASAAKPRTSTGSIRLASLSGSTGSSISGCSLSPPPFVPEPMERPRCQCMCDCPHRPGRGGRRMCRSCGHLVGPGCCWCGDDVGLCHICNAGNPQEMARLCEPEDDSESERPPPAAANRLRGGNSSTLECSE